MQWAAGSPAVGSGQGWDGAPGCPPAPNRLTSPLSPGPADLYSAEPGEEEPAWVQTEREQFRDFRDLNKDGRLDGSEVGHWVLPPAQDQPLVEANHLLHESDTDKVRTGGRCAHVAGPGLELPWGAVGPGTERGTERPREGVGEGEGQRPRVCWGGKLRFREESPRQGPLSPLLPSDPPSRMGV